MSPAQVIGESEQEDRHADEGGAVAEDAWPRQVGFEERLIAGPTQMWVNEEKCVPAFGFRED